jgi:hypothetical protein
MAPILLPTLLAAGAVLALWARPSRWSPALLCWATMATAISTFAW